MPFFYSGPESILSVGWERFRIAPGFYHLVVEFCDPSLHYIGRWKNRIFVKDFFNQNLALSDIVLASEIGGYQEKGELRKGGMRIVPNTLETYPVTSSIPIYFEIYNLTYSVTGGTHYRLILSVECMDKKKSSLGKLIQKIWQKNKSPSKVVTTFEFSGDQRNESLYQMLEIKNPVASDYRLIIEIEDMNSGEKTSQEKMIALKEQP